MSSKLLVNVNDATPSVVPDTDVPGATTPDTGMFSVSHVDGVSFNTSMILPIIGIAVLIIAIIAGTVVVISRRRKVNRFTTHTNKHLVAKLTTLSVVVLLGALGVMNADKLTSMVNATADDSEDSLTITASDIKIDVDLNDTAVFATGESVVAVNSATPYGYTLMAYVDSATTDLINETNTSSTSTIDMLDSLEPTVLADNTWGFATTRPTDQTSAVFTGIPNTLKEATTLKYTEEPTTANDESTFYYGTYVTPDLDYGTYSGVTITYVAIANICNPLATNIGEAVCLQDFAGPNRDRIVDSMTPERQYTLIDKRDKKPYTLAKYPALGHARSQTPVFQVWMTQNLDLDLDSNITYTNKDTDLGYNAQTKQYETASWIPSTSTYITNDKTWRGSYTTPESYDIGNKYWNGRIDEGNGGYGAIWGDYFQTCSWESEYRPFNCDESLNPTSYFVSSNGIPQYHLGNYYNWTAAVAMNDSSSYNDGQLIEQSICPTGWTLPRVGSGEDTFNTLWMYYGLVGGWNSYNEDYSLWMEPLYFVASGGWYGYLGYVGTGGDYWSSATDDNQYAGVGIFNTRVYTPSFSGGGNRDTGISIRCMARPVSSSLSSIDANA